MTLTSVITTRRVFRNYTQCDYEKHECDFNTQSVVSTLTSVVLTRMRVNMKLTSVIYTRRV
jgi:hypothetical protein